MFDFSLCEFVGSHLATRGYVAVVLLTQLQSISPTANQNPFLFIFYVSHFYLSFFFFPNPKIFSVLADKVAFEISRCCCCTQHWSLSESRQCLKSFQSGRLVSHDPETHLPLRPPPAVIRPAWSSVSRQLRGDADRLQWILSKPK